MKIIDLSKLTELNPVQQWAAKLKDAAQEWPRVECAEKGWQITLSHSTGRKGAWRLSARRCDKQAERRHLDELVRALGAPGGPITEQLDSQGFLHWAWD